MSSSIPFPGSHWISLDTAKAMTARYRDHRNSILQPKYQDQNMLSICETFNRTELDWVLAQEGCVGYRVYFGMEEDLKVKVIIVGVNAENQDILPSASLSATVTTDPPPGLIEMGRPCPEFCPTPPL